MHSATDPAAPHDIDPLLRAAIARFSREGFRAPLRGIAEDAGVSAALLLKRFGSKEALREACDEVVREWIRRVKSENIGAAARGTLMLTLPAAQREASVLLGYIVHAVLDGGALGRHLLEEMVTDAEGYIAEAIAQGLVHPSRDERARARYLVQSGLGSLLISTLLAPPDEAGDPADPELPGALAALHRLEAETTLPALELYTEGFFTTSAVYDQYLAATASGPPEHPEQPTEQEETP